MGFDTNEEPSWRDELYASYVRTHAGRSRTQTHVFTAEMAPHLFPDRQSRIFDVGCGQGGLLLELRRAGYVNAYGIDRSPEQVAIARERGRHGVAEGDFRSRVGQQTRFDTIIAIDVLEHIPRDLRLDTLQPFGTSLNHRGKLIARTPDAAIPFGGNYHYGDRTDEWSLTVRSLRQLDSSEPR